MVWKVFEGFLAKVHEWIELWTSICSRCPVFAARWCFGRYEGWLSRALGQLGCMEDEYKVCLSSGLQEVKVFLVLKCFFFLKPRGSSSYAGL